MSNAILATANMLGAVFFGLAALWGVFNHREEVEATDFWTTYLFAAIGGSIFLFLRVLEWGGVTPLFLDDVQPFFGIVSITLLAANATSCALSPVKRQVK